MKSGLNKIFWGFIFVIVNINIGSFYILPNFIGYCLIYAGCKALSEKNKSFKKVNNILPVVICLSILDYFKTTINSLIIAESITIIIFGVAEMYIVYNICKGIYEMAKEACLEEFTKVIQFRCNFYLYTYLAVQITMPFIFNTGNETLKIILVIISIISLISNILIITMVNRAKKEIKFQ